MLSDRITNSKLNNKQQTDNLSRFNVIRFYLSIYIRSIMKNFCFLILFLFSGIITQSSVLANGIIRNRTTLPIWVYASDDNAPNGPVGWFQLSPNYCTPPEWDFDYALWDGNQVVGWFGCKVINGFAVNVYADSYAPTFRAWFTIMEDWPFRYYCDPIAAPHYCPFPEWPMPLVPGQEELPPDYPL